jgi:hypothetical protein
MEDTMAIGTDEITLCYLIKNNLLSDMLFPRQIQTDFFLTGITMVEVKDTIISDPTPYACPCFFMLIDEISKVFFIPFVIDKAIFRVLTVPCSASRFLSFFVFLIPSSVIFPSISLSLYPNLLSVSYAW